MLRLRSSYGTGCIQSLNSEARAGRGANSLTCVLEQAMFDMRLPASDGHSMVAFGYARVEQVSQDIAEPGNPAESGTYVVGTSGL